MKGKTGILVGAALGAAVGAKMAMGGWHGITISSDSRRILPAAILWVIFSLYWSIAARNAAPTSSSESAGSTSFHQIALTAALLLLLWPVIPGLNGQYLPATDLFVALGAVIQASFIALAVWARHHLGRNWSAEVRIAVDHELVRTGPYRMLRHPIYTAMLGMFVGTAVATGQYHSLVAVLLLVILYRRKTSLEEQILLKTFGPDYETYRHDTWALVPWVF